MNEHDHKQDCGIVAGDGSEGQLHRHRFDAIVEINEMVCREHFLLRVRVKEVTGPGRPGSQGKFPATQPGQFIELGCRPPGAAEFAEQLRGGELECAPGKPPKFSQPELLGPLALLRRPFSLSGRGEDENGTWLEVIHRVVGVGTAWLSTLKKGDAVDLIGPLGNAFRKPEGKSIGLFVGGGVGLPPMFYLSQWLAASGWSGVGFVGAMSRDLLAVHLNEKVAPSSDGSPTLCVREFANVGIPAVITTDDGSLGLRGRITAGLEQKIHAMSAAEKSKAVIFTCGPERMMHAVAKLAAQNNIDCQVCMEQAMACGMGTCQSCIVKIDPTNFGQEPQGKTAEGRPWRFKLACTDGPVFDAKDVIW